MRPYMTGLSWDICQCCTYSHCVSRVESGQTAGSVLDGELLAVLLVGARFAAVVLLVEPCTAERQQDKQNEQPYSEILGGNKTTSQNNSRLDKLKKQNKKSSTYCRSHLRWYKFWIVFVKQFVWRVSCQYSYLQQGMLQKWHFLEGTHRLDEPVSKMTWKLWGGVPMLISP